MEKTIFTVTGPTCAGKSTLAKLMVERLGCSEIVSTTTRQPRSGEIDGQHYFFVSKPQFEEKIQRGDMVEYSRYGGEYYGLSYQAINQGFQSNNTLVAVLDPDGAINLRKNAGRMNTKINSIFVGNSTNDLLVRLLTRYRCDCILKTEEYAERVKSLLGPEQDWGKKLPYEMQIKIFDEDNIDETVEDIQNEFFVVNTHSRLGLTG